MVVETEPAFHYVCTRGEAWTLVEGEDRFWVSNCGCRESRGNCGRSRMDLCLLFQGDAGASGSGLHEVSRAEVEAIFREAREKHLVSRPFRSEDRSRVDGICFCCDDCCGYFTGPEENPACGRGPSIERTDQVLCANCGTCVEVCHFQARRLAGYELKVDRGRCYGCGLCTEACEQGAIGMAPR